jgi:hypothetical protein
VDILHFVSPSYIAKSSNAFLPSLSIVSLISSLLGVKRHLKALGRMFSPFLRIQKSLALSLGTSPPRQDDDCGRYGDTYV